MVTQQTDATPWTDADAADDQARLDLNDAVVRSMSAQTHKSSWRINTSSAGVVDLNRGESITLLHGGPYAFTVRIVGWHMTNGPICEVTHGNPPESIRSEIGSGNLLNLCSDSLAVYKAESKRHNRPVETAGLQTFR